MEQWDHVNAVQNMQDYIHQHLSEPITLKELSRKAGYSPYHCAKLFKEHVGKAPFEYIRTLRLSRAALKLRDEKVKEALYEPIGLWLPDRFRPTGTSIYAQGVEVPADYAGAVPEGFEIIDLPACSMMVFQGPPFENDDFLNAVFDLSELIDKYRPEISGYEWDDEGAPRFQMEPQGYRGYIEARPVRKKEY